VEEKSIFAGQADAKITAPSGARSCPTDAAMRTIRKNTEKLRGQTRELASKFIAEEIRTGKYPREQAIAIGISRARRQAEAIGGVRKIMKRAEESSKKAIKVSDSVIKNHSGFLKKVEKRMAERKKRLADLAKFLR
jgi:hypothetical protein